MICKANSPTQKTQRKGYWNKLKTNTFNLL